MPLNLHHLRVFSAVAEHGGFSRAAGALNVSQPAVSKAVHELERQVGMPLFDRSGRTLRRTPAGDALYTRARELFGVEELAEEELRALRGLERGTLRVGASTTVATYFLPPCLGEFARAHPGVALQLVSANTRAIARAVVERRIDVALVEGPVQDERITTRRWREDELVVIAPPAHALARKRSVHAADLAAYAFIVREPGSGTRVVASRALAQAGVHVPVAMQLGSTEAIKQAVAAGLGLAIVSRVAAHDQLELERVVEVRVRDLVMRRSLNEIALTGRPASATAAAFQSVLRDRRD
jgi:DNA-binding transcriptional LysR family regulator